MSYADHIIIDGVQYDIRDAEAVSFEQEQTLTDAQKEQARANIGAGSEADVVELKSAINTDEVVLKNITGFTGQTTYAGYVNASGELISAESGWVRTDYILTSPGARLVSSLKGYSVFPVVAFYDANKTYLSNASVISNQQLVVDTDITVPDGVTYAIFVSQTNYADRSFSIDVPMSIGETVDYLFEEVGSIKDEIRVSGHFVDITGFDGHSTIAGYIKTDGTFVDGGSGWVRTDYIETGAGANVISSLKGYSANPIVAFYDEQKQYLQSASIISDKQYIVNTNTKVPQGVKYAVFATQTSYSDASYQIGVPANIGETVEQVSSDVYGYSGINVVCIGDSLTAGRDGVGNILVKNYPYWMQESRLKNCNIKNLGIAGSTTKTYWDSHKSEIDVDQYDDIVLMMWGTNGGLVDTNAIHVDVEPYNDYEDYADTGVGCYCKIIEYVMELSQNKAQIILLTPPYNGDTSINSRVINAQPVVKQIAERYKIPCVDMFQSGINEWNYTIYMPDDSVHFSEEGYKWIGKYIGSCVDAVCNKIK